MSDQPSAFGLIGLAVMGQNLARNVARQGYRTSVYNRTTTITTDFIETYSTEKNLVGHTSLASFVNSLVRPRKIMLMVKAGEAVDKVIEQLTPLLDPGDIIIDGGNSLFTDTIRREEYCRKQNIHFFGCGVSGGEEGALLGPSLMPGGEKNVYHQLQPIFQSIAAKDFAGNPCVTYISPNGSGHFVKMVHNGIEYAIMQMIAEAYQLLKTGYNLKANEIADIFSTYNHGRLQSFLLEIAVPVLRKIDEKTGQPLIDHILDQAGQKGTGRWTAIEGLKNGAEISTIVQAVNARVSSSQLELRKKYAALYGTNSRDNFLEIKDCIPKLEAALYAAITMAYHQGFELLDLASETYGWKINNAEVCRIWQGGCIIRAKTLVTFSAAFQQNPGQKLLLIPTIATDIKSAWNDWRKIIGSGVKIGVPLYSLGAALTSFESLVSTKTSANLIQGLRDFFGAHTFERIDRAGIFHADWNK